MRLNIVNVIGVDAFDFTIDFVQQSFLVLTYSNTVQSASEERLHCLNMSQMKMLYATKTPFNFLVNNLS